MTANTSDIAPELLTRDRAATRLGISTRMLDRLTATGELPTIRIGARTLIDPADIAALVASRRAAARRPSADASPTAI